MERNSMTDQHLTGSRWLCIPYLIGAPARLEAEFFADKTGLTRYELLGSGRRFETKWGWRLSETTPNLLDIVWSDGTIAPVEFEIVDVAFTVNNWDGEPTTFASKLLLSAHLFPLGREFPDGWPQEYFGYRQEHE
jgi:hypothetical protein